MSLHERLTQARQANFCRVCAYLKTLTPEEQAEWHAELRLPWQVVGHQAIATILAEEGVRVSSNGVAGHRRNHESPT